jgi:hypothetical protein
VCQQRSLFGAPCKSPASFSPPPPDTFACILHSAIPYVVPLRPPVPSCTTSTPPQLLPADFLYVPLAAPAVAQVYRGPYAVHKRAAKVFIVKVGSRYEAVSIDRLKPHLGSQPFLAVPPSRGRPLQRPPVGSSSGPQASTGGGDVRAVMFDSI